MREETVVIEGKKFTYGHLGSGPPLVMLHGLGDVWGRDDPTLALLARHFEVFLPNLPGYQGSDPFAEYSLAAYSKFLYQFCQVLSIKPVYLLGHSMGTFYACAFAARYWDFVKKVILTGAPIHFSFWEALAIWLVNLLAPILVQSKLLTKIFRWIMEKTPLKRKWLDEETSFRDVDLKALAFGFAVLGRRSLIALSRKVSRPKLFIWGAQDPVFSLEKAKVITDPVIIIGRAGHEPMVDAPYSYFARLRGFFLECL